jgi:hypothetical protein
MRGNHPQRAAAGSATTDAEGHATEETAALREAAETAIAAALQTAAAGSRSGSLHITSCSMEAAGADSAAILRALPASKLTSLQFEYDFFTPYCSQQEEAKLADETTLAEVWALGQAIKSLQQLRQLQLKEHSYEVMTHGSGLHCGTRAP